MEPIGLVAVILAFSVPLAAMYAWYRVRKLRTKSAWPPSPREWPCPWPMNCRRTRVRARPQFC